MHDGSTGLGSASKVSEEKGGWWKGEWEGWEEEENQERENHIPGRRR
jgi:hypothetical protein